MVKHLVTDIALKCGHINNVEPKECSHNPACPKTRRLESHVELKAGLCQTCDDARTIHIHFRYLSDMQSLERYWSTRSLCSNISIRGPFTIQVPAAIGVMDGSEWRTVWRKQILRCVNGAKNGATTVFMAGLEDLPLNELDARGEEFVEGAILQMIGEIGQATPAR